jgi:hypothetical protein
MNQPNLRGNLTINLVPQLMDELENTHLPQMIKFDWAKQMKASLPGMRTKVLDDVNEQMKNWLLQMRETHRQVGRLAMDATVLRQRSKFENLRRDRSGSVGDISRGMHMMGQQRSEQDMNQLIRKSMSVELALNEENECGLPSWTIFGDPTS